MMNSINSKLSCLLVVFAILTSHAEKPHTIRWKELAPSKVQDPFEKLNQQQLQKLGLVARVKNLIAADKVKPDGPTAKEAAKLEAELRKSGVDVAYLLSIRDQVRRLREKQANTALRHLDGKVVRVAGYAVPLKIAGNRIFEFLVVPNADSCSDTRLPSLNQAVFVQYKEGVAVQGRQAAVRVTGRFEARQTTCFIRRKLGVAKFNAGYVIVPQEVEVFSGKEGNKESSTVKASAKRNQLGNALLTISAQTSKPAAIKLTIEPSTSIRGSSKWDWWQARSAYVPGPKPLWLTTMSETGKTGTHNFHDIYVSMSHDAGNTWTRPTVIESLRRTKQDDGYEVTPGDLWPTWHAVSGMVLVTGKTFNFEAGKRENRLRERVSYVVYDPMSKAWSKMRFLKMPAKDHAGHTITGANAGCTQRVDLANGDVLLPVRYWRDPKKHNYTSTVALCSFDGKQLTYKKHGTELNIPQGRGLYEPSLAKLGEYYYLTMRADQSAYVAKSRDGLNFNQLKEWTFDDGKVLGSYNTQQHWVTIGGGLFLVYTRKGADNDHVFRHRAPLFIAQVNPDTLQVIRKSERIAIPEDHTTLGNSGICRINDNESWITCGEGLLRLGKRKGQTNKVLIVKLRTN